MKPADVINMIREQDVKMVDLRFLDFPGLWQHFTVPSDVFSESDFEDGLGIDGSSMRGWRSINESDMLVVPDPATAFIDPFMKMKTLVMICNVQEPVTRQDYLKDPRNVARKAEKYLKGLGIADTAFFGPEPEFFIFDNVQFDQDVNQGFYFLDSVEGCWNSGTDEGPNLGYKPRHQEAYFPVPPTDCYQDLRSEMTEKLVSCGIPVEVHHHEVASGGQSEIDMRFDSLVKMCDKVMMFKYIIKNAAREHNKTVTFMPKPLLGGNGSGMHLHVSLWKDGENLFYGNKYAGMSEMALYAIGGIIKHAKALVALTNPTTNSYKRLVPHYEAPTRLAYSSGNRSAAVRIPLYSANPKAKRFEFRCPDPSCNPYLAFSAVLMAAIDGIKNKIDPGGPLDKDIYDMPPEELKDVPSTPASLADALYELENDHEFLLAGDVFSEDVISTWIKYKRDNEVKEIRLRPHPYEFALYYDL